MNQNNNSNDQTQAEKTSTNQPDNLNVIAGIGYIGPLFLVPLLAHPKNEFAVFHANQGLLLLITAFIVNAVAGVLWFFFWFLMPLINLLLLALVVYGFINAYNHKMVRLPLIGNFDLLKVQK